jgi:hypothetical protein
MANEGSSIGGAIAIAVGVLFIYMALRRMIFMVRGVACVGVCVPHSTPALLPTIAPSHMVGFYARARGFPCAHRALLL